MKYRTPGALAALMVGIFVLDLLTPLSYSVWVGYLVPILLVDRRVGRPLFYAFPAAATLFIILDPLLHLPNFSLLPLMVTRRLAGILVIWVVAYILSQSRKAEQKHAEADRRLEESEERFRKIFEEGPLGMCVVGLDFHLLKVNSRLCQMLGYTEAELAGMSVKAFMHPEDFDRDLSLGERLLRGEAPFITLERRYCRKGGEMVWGSVTASIVRSESGEPLYLIGMVEDISRRKRMEAAITHQAYHDMLTDLPNRALFMDRLEFELSQALRFPRRMALLFLDLDRFKNINDTLGHTSGDELLSEVADRLKGCVRETDLIARVGGDEFSILLTTIAKNEDAAHVAEKVIAAFHEPFSISGHALNMSTSIGISLFPEDGEQGETLYKNADIAMYHAKELGRNNFQFYSHAINIRTIERMLLESSLRQTLERGDLVVYYQPQIDAATNKIVCVEALVRWRHPELGLLDPRRFISIAEETGFITALDEWVLRTACRQMEAWQKAGAPPLCLMVNLSARQFHQPALIETVARAVSDAGLPPSWLGIEITENTAMQDIVTAVATLKKLSGMGVQLSLDDFGTGYSSLSYLRSLPINRVKIDKSFISRIVDNPEDLAIVRAIIAMGHHLNLRVIAEGVETGEQLLLLKQEGCDELQGFYYSKPLPAEEIEKVIALYA